MCFLGGHFLEGCPPFRSSRQMLMSAIAYPGASGGMFVRFPLTRVKSTRGDAMAEQDRRSFLRTAGSFGVATTVGLASGVGLARPTDAAGQEDSHPFGYPEGGLDVERTRELGYRGFKGITLRDGTRHSGCGFGTFNAIIGQLAKVVGAPYTHIPPQMMDWAGAGVVGFGSLCGTLGGASAAIGLICEGKDARGFISDLLTWYSETALPTNIHPASPPLPQSVAGSNLCHVSLTRWCTTSGFASGSPERAERCSRLAGDVAARAVELLNQGALGLEKPAEKTVCRSCHYMGADYAVGQFTHGEMNCLTCHIDLKDKRVGPDGH